MQSSIFEVRITIMDLVLLAEFGGKGDRQENMPYPWS
jgi:hypothetical protein